MLCPLRTSSRNEASVRSILQLLVWVGLVHRRSPRRRKRHGQVQCGATHERCGSAKLDVMQHPQTHYAYYVPPRLHNASCSGSHSWFQSASRGESQCGSGV